MRLNISFDLSEGDLRHFDLIMTQARCAARETGVDAVLRAARKLLANARQDKPPQFVAKRLDNLETMVDMLSDQEWRLPKTEARRIVNALVYFVEPDDLIPDHIPGLGFLDDAIMIELVARDMKHGIDAYRDFCRYRDELAATGDPTRKKELELKRQRLLARMTRRSKRDR